MVLAKSIGRAGGALALLLLAGCDSAHKGAAQQTALAPEAAIPAARFEWFKYSGNDPAFETAGDLSTGYLNPVLAGFYPDPSVTRAGDDY